MEEEKKIDELEETEVAPIEPKRETIQFPWAAAIVIGVLAVLVIACFITVMILGPQDVVPPSGSSINSSL